jgi:hypothetical protein
VSAHVIRAKTAIVLTVAGLVGIFALDRGAGLLTQNAVIGLLLVLCGVIVLLDRWVGRAR